MLGILNAFDIVRANDEQIARDGISIDDYALIARQFETHYPALKVYDIPWIHSFTESLIDPNFFTNPNNAVAFRVTDNKEIICFLRINIYSDNYQEVPILPQYGWRTLVRKLLIEHIRDITGGNAVDQQIRSLLAPAIYCAPFLPPYPNPKYLVQMNWTPHLRAVQTPLLFRPVVPINSSSSQQNYTSSQFPRF